MVHQVKYRTKLDVITDVELYNYYKGKYHIAFWDKFYISSHYITDIRDIHLKHVAGLPKADILYFVDSWFELAQCSYKKERKNILYEIIKRKKEKNKSGMCTEERSLFFLSLLCEYVEWEDFSIIKNVPTLYFKKYLEVRCKYSCLRLNSLINFYKNFCQRKFRKSGKSFKDLYKEIKKEGFTLDEKSLKYLLQDEPFLYLKNKRRVMNYMGAFYTKMFKQDSWPNNRLKSDPIYLTTYRQQMTYVSKTLNIKLPITKKCIYQLPFN